MSGEVNIKIIQGVYEAFGRGDVVAAVLGGRRRLWDDHGAVARLGGVG